MTSLECPYCGVKIDDDPNECYDYSVTYERECLICKKNFIFGVGYIRYYRSFRKLPE